VTIASRAERNDAALAAALLPPRPASRLLPRAECPCARKRRLAALLSIAVRDAMRRA